MEKFDFTSAKKTSETTKDEKSNDGLSSLFSTILGNLGDNTSSKNGSTIYNIIKMLA